MVVAWLAVAVALGLFELRHLAFYALFGAVGALADALLVLDQGEAHVAFAAVAEPDAR